MSVYSEIPQYKRLPKNNATTVYLRTNLLFLRAHPLLNFIVSSCFVCAYTYLF